MNMENCIDALLREDIPPLIFEIKGEKHTFHPSREVVREIMRRALKSMGGDLAKHARDIGKLVAGDTSILDDMTEDESKAFGKTFAAWADSTLKKPKGGGPWV